MGDNRMIDAFCIEDGGSIVVNMPEDPALGTVTETSSKDKEHSLFSGVLDKFMFKNINFVLTAKETSDQNMSREARHAEPSSTDLPLSDPIEPTCLASKIRSLLKVLPLPSRSAFKPPKDLEQPEHENHGCPILSHGIAQIDDARLVAMLQSETVMNGSRLGDDVRMSVWSALESLEDEVDENKVRGTGDEDSRSMSIMLYSPLTPTNLSLVEIAESGVFEPEEQGKQIVDSTSDTARVAGWMGMWPFSVWSTSGAAGPDTLLDAGPAPSVATSSPSPSSRTPRLHAQARKHVWIPSSTQLSFQTLWWGYRIYLPPPIMDILGDKSMEYAKRAVTLTTALTWFFHNMPLAALPVAVRPAVLLLQTLIPYIGYIGSLISWSWGTIQSYDTGHGVILSATWLLPVALIPSTWETNSFPLPSLPSSPNQTLPQPGSSLCPMHKLPPTAEPTSPDTLLYTTNSRPEVPDAPPTEQFLSPAQSFVMDLSSSLQSPASAPPPLIYLSPTLSPSSPVHFSNANSNNTDARSLSPIYLASSDPTSSSSAFLYPSQPLPPWVLPPPPPSPLIIPLPEIEEEEDT